nr:hypothetical protein [Tanacetum cinerariifolium]
MRESGSKSASGGSEGGRRNDGLSSKLESDDSSLEKEMESSISNASRKRMSPYESSAKFSVPGGIKLSERNKSASSKRGSLVESSEISFFTRFTWTHFLTSKDETPEVLIDFLRLVQRGLQAQVRVVRTNKGTKFLNKTLRTYFAAEGIQHQTSIARTPEQNGSNQSRAYRVFNKRTRVIMESIHVNFDELPQMVSAHNSSDPAPTCQTMASVQINSDLAPECQTMALEHDSLSLEHKCQENVSHGDKTESHAESDQITDDEFINIFSTPVQGQGDTSSRHVDSSNMHTFYQRYPSEHRWTKDHPLEQVIGNPSQSIRTRQQLESDDDMCMFALTVGRTEPKNIKEAMADST